MGAAEIILADTCNGKSLSTEDGPYRLVAPGEKRAARSARQLMSLEIATP